MAHCRSLERLPVDQYSGLMSQILNPAQLSFHTLLDYMFWSPPLQAIDLGVDAMSSKPLCVTSSFVLVPATILDEKRNYSPSRCGHGSFLAAPLPQTVFLVLILVQTTSRWTDNVSHLRNSVRFHDDITLEYPNTTWTHGLRRSEDENEGGRSGFDGMIDNWWDNVDLLENHARSEDHPSPIRLDSHFRIVFVSPKRHTYAF